MEIIKGENVAECLSFLGVSCEFVRYSTSCQLITYEFCYKGDYNASFKRVLAKAIDNLSVHLGCDITIKYPKNGVLDSFSLVLVRSERYFPSILTVHQVLKDKPRTILLGVDENNKTITVKLEQLPHLLIGGSSGSGKSVLLNDIICTLAGYNSGKAVAMVLIDLKRVEFAQYRKLPHLWMKIALDFPQAVTRLTKVNKEMDKRYKKMERLRIVKAGEVFPHLVVVIDELSDLMLDERKKVIMPLLKRLAQKGRACNICLILATQQPTAEVVNNLIKANMGTRVCLQTRTVAESNTVMGKQGGGDKLLGKGDAMLMLNTQVERIRIQVPYIDDSIIKKVVKQ